MTLLKEKATDLYQWASQNTSEATQVSESFERIKAERASVESHDFFETPFFRLLMFRIKNTPHALIGILGLQGTGKTRTLTQLSRSFPDAIYFKWSVDWRKRLLQYPEAHDNYASYLEGEANDLFMELGHKGIQPKWMKKLGADSVSKMSEALQEKIIGRVKADELKKEAASMVLEGKKLILLDFPDYNKYDPFSMNRDFEELQKFWYSLQSSETGLVIAMQKELIMRNPHFFIGKMDIMNLEPLSSDALMAAFKYLRKDSELFGDDAIKLLAELSRGVFRRFKKYIKLIIESNLNTTIPLHREHVEQAITEAVLMESMELELGEIFKERGKRIEALKVLNYVRQNPQTNMKSIAESLNIPETMVQRVVHNLELYGYVMLSRGKGKELLISLL
jgi:hypothetical protein